MVTSPTGAMKLIWLVPALPLAGAVVNLFFGKRLGKFAGWLATGLLALSAVIAAVAVRDLMSLPAESRVYVLHMYEWIRVGALSIGADLRLDPLSATMICVVTGVGSLIHLYSNGYMHGDPRFGRFFAYMNLFAFFMLMLVLGQNLLILYLGWEGVGLCSYLLIGFWFEKTENANAAKKAFVTTRIGDTAMLIGLALIVSKFGTLDLTQVFGAATSTLTKDAATAIALLLFAGAIGKSAQVPASRLASRRHGGPLARLGLDPRGHHGDRRRLPGRSDAPDLRDLGRRAGRRDRNRSDHGAVRRHMRLGSGRHQTRPRVLDHQPARLHVRGGRVCAPTRRPCSCWSPTPSTRP